MLGVGPRIGDDDRVVSEDERDEPSAPRWAADEPTAMWDDSLLKESGYDALAEHRAAEPRAETGPATQREVKGDVAGKVTVSGELTGGHPAQPAPAARPPWISWVVTLALAVLLGGVAYFVVRLIR